MPGLRSGSRHFFCALLCYIHDYYSIGEKNMRLQEVQLDSSNNLLLDIMKLPPTCVIVISDGKAKLSELPAFAETNIVTHGGKVKRIRWNEGEEF